MTADNRLVSERFPRSSRVPSRLGPGQCQRRGQCALGDRVADRGAGPAGPACGCWTSAAAGRHRRSFCGANSGSRCGPPTCGSAPSENIQRIRDAGVEDGVFPLHADARSLPFAPEFFDAIVCIDSFLYYGTDDLYLNYLAQFVKPGGPIGDGRGRAGAGDRRPCSRSSSGVVDPGLLGLPFGGVVAAALGTDRHRRR